jgi:hypothetical protein
MECTMKLLIFTEGTILMHPEGMGLDRQAIVRQILEKTIRVNDYATHVPIGNAVAKLNTWQHQGAEIVYLTSRTKPEQIKTIRNVLARYDFPEGELFYRHLSESYADVATRVLPNILIEDDCESIGGQVEMTYPHINAELKKRIQSIAVKEFGGIGHLPDDLSRLFSA